MGDTVVTGGAGFIGSHLTKTLLDVGYNVRVIDNLSTGSLTNLTPVLNKDSKLKLYTYSIEHLEELIELFQGARYVFHLAAIPRIQRSVEDPIGTAKINIMGTLNVLEAARQAGVKRVVFSSSSSVKTKRSPYAVQKSVGEDLVRLYNDLYGLETVILRYFNVYGPNMDSESDYATVIARFLKEDPVTIYGDGDQTRGFCYVDDIVDATFRAGFISGVSGMTYDIGSEPRTINELAGMVGKPITYAAPRPGEQYFSKPDTSDAYDHLGWEPKISLEEGLDRTHKWFKSVIL